MSTENSIFDCSTLSCGVRLTPLKNNSNTAVRLEAIITKLPRDSYISGADILVHVREVLDCAKPFDSPLCSEV